LKAKKIRINLGSVHFFLLPQTSNLVVDDGGGKGRIRVRGLRYIDDFVKTPEGWRIRHRVHIPIWQYEVVSVPPGLPQAK